MPENDDPTAEEAPASETDGEEPAPEAADDADLDPTGTDADADADAGDSAAEGDAGEAKAETREDRKAKADAVIAQRTVTRRTVQSRRVTPKAGTAPAKGAAPAASSKARDAKKTEQIVTRTTPPPSTVIYDKGPSPWWVPAIMFGLLIVGMLVIALNYMGAFGEASNIYLVIGLGLILGGIIAATQYR